MEAPKRPAIPTYAPKKPDVPVVEQASGAAQGRSGENRSRLCWSIVCSNCGYVNGTTNYAGARDSALQRLRDQQKACPECGGTEWEAAETSD
jgi:ribosomal protein S27AE